jgi:hypothetical protein
MTKYLIFVYEHYQDINMRKTQFNFCNNTIHYELRVQDTCNFIFLKK